MRARLGVVGVADWSCMTATIANGPGPDQGQAPRVGKRSPAHANGVRLPLAKSENSLEGPHQRPAVPLRAAAHGHAGLQRGHVPLAGAQVRVLPLLLQPRALRYQSVRDDVPVAEHRRDPARGAAGK